MDTVSFRNLLFALIAFMFSITSIAAADLSEASGKYYAMLRERPESEVIFDRFYDQWLEASSLADLETMLVEACASEGAVVNDFRILALFYQRQGDPGAALRVLRSALEADEADEASGVLWLECARVEWALLNFDQAIHSLRQALKLDLDEDSRIEARRLLGAIHARSGQLEEAQTVWTRLMADYPGERALMEDLIELQIGEGLLSEALATAHQLVEQTREPYQKALNKLLVGEILQRQGETVAALELYSGLIDRVGNGSWLEREILAQISRLLANQAGEVDALDFFTELSARYPQRIEIRKERLRLLAASGQVDAAVGAFQEILRLMPGDREQREAYVDLLQRHGRLTEAISEIEKLCEAYPNDTALYLQRVELQGQVGDEAGLKQAIEAFAQSVGTAPDARLRVARLYAGFDFEAEAGAIHAALAEAYPEDLEMVESYALWLHGQGDGDTALELLMDAGRGLERDGLLRVAQTLVSVGEGAASYALLKERIDDFGLDAIFLQQLCQMAMVNEAAEEALPWARILVLQAGSPLEMSRAVQLTAQVARQAKAMDALIIELQAAAEDGALPLPDLCLLAELEEAQGDSRASDDTLARLRAFGGPIALSEEVRLFENRRQPSLAIEALEQLIALPGQENPVNLRRLVGLLEAERQWEEALAAIDAWKRISPGDPQVWMRETDVLEASGQLELAKQQLRRAAHRFEGEADLRLRLAALFKQTQQYVDAERIYWRMYEAEETVTERLRWLHELAVSASESGRVTEYAQRLEAMRQADRQALLPLLAMADLHRLENDWPQLLTTLQEAERLQPENVEVLDQLITTYENVGEYQLAEASLRRLLSLEPTEANRRRLVNFFMRTGEQEAAFALIKSSTSTAVPDAASLESFIDLLMESGEWELAEIEALAARRPFPEDWRIGYQLAVCYAENFKDAKAFELFLELWQTREPLDRLQKSAATPGVNRYLEGLPPASREIASILQASHPVFMYQRPASHWGGHSMNAASRQFLHLADDLSSLHRAVVLQLGALASAFDEAPRQKAIDRMAAAGIPSPELFVAIEGARPANGNWIQSFARHADANPEQLELLPLMAQYSAYSQNTALGLDKESALLGLETYAADYPRLGMQFAFQLIHLDPDNASHYVDRLLGMLGDETWSIDSQSELMVVGQLLNLVNVGRQSVHQVELTAAQRARLRDLAAANHEPAKLSASNPQAARIDDFAFQVLVALALEEADRAAFIELLDAHLTAWEAHGTSPQLHMQRAYITRVTRQGNSLDLTVPAFSPFQSGFVADDVAILFMKEPVRQHHPMMQFMNPKRIREMDAFELGQNLDDFDHPRLRFLAAWRSGQVEICGGILRELTAVDSPRMEDLKLLALWQHHEAESSEAALQTLERARSFASDRAGREELDKLIVAMALAMPEDTWAGTPPDSLQSTVTSAALRLRSSVRRSSGQVPELASAMRTVGMEAEAHRFEESVQRVSASGLRSAHPTVSNPFTVTAQDPLSRMETFAQEGKVDAAVGMAVRHLRPLLAQASVQRNRLRHPIQRIEKANLSDPVLARFDPQGSRSHRRMESYAVLLDAFGRGEEAGQLWQELQAMRPNESAYVLESAFRTPDGAGAIEKLLNAVSYERIDEQIGGWMAEQSQHAHELSFNEWMRLLEMAVHIMNGFEPSARDSVNFSWAPFLAVKFVQLSNIEREQYPSLIARGAYRGGSADQGEAFDARVEERSNRYEAFCRAMLRHPQTCEQGFELLFLKRSAEVADPFSDPSLAAAARSAVLLGAQYTPPVTHHARSGQRWAFISSGNSSYSNSNFDGLHPLVFLIRLFERGEAFDFGQLAAELAPHDPALAADVEAIAALLTADATQFPSLIQEWIATEGSSLRMPLLFEAFRMGSASDPAFEALFEFGRAELAGTAVFQEPDAALCARIALIFAEQGRGDFLEQWFDEVFTFHLGPKDKWGDKIATYTPSGMYLQGSANYQLSRAWQFAQRMSEEGALVLPLVRYTRHTGIGMSAHSLHHFRQSLENGFDEVSEALAWCERQQLLTSFEQFDPLIVLDAQRLQQGLPIDSLPTSRNTVLYERALRSLSFRDDAEGEKKQQFLAQLKKRDFGGQILAAFLEGASAGRSTAVAALEAEASAFRSLPAAEQKNIAFLYRFWIQDGQSTDADTVIVTDLQRIWQEDLRTEANEYLSLDTPLTDQTYHPEQQQLRGWIAALVWEAPDLAAQLYLHWLERESVYVPTNQRFTPKQRDSYNESVLRSAFNQTRRNGQALESLNRYFAYVADQQPAGSVPLTLQNLRQLREVWDRRLRDETGNSNPGFEKILAAITELASPKGNAPERFISALGLFDYVLNRYRYNANDADQIASILDTEDMDTSIHRRWLHAAMLARMVGDYSGHQAAAEVFAEILDDTDVPVEIRLALWMAAHQQSSSRWLYQAALAEPSCALMAAFMDEGLPVFDRDWSETLKRVRPAFAEPEWQAPLQALLPRLVGYLPSQVYEYEVEAAEDVVEAIIRMALELDELETALAVIQQHFNLVRGDSRILFAMLNAGRIDAAVRLTPPDGAFDVNTGMRYTADLHTQLPEYLSKIANPTARYNLAVEMGSLEDAAELAESGVPDRAARCTALLQDFGAHQDGLRAIKQLNRLCTYASDKSGALPYASALFGSRSFADLAEAVNQGSSGERQRARELLELYKHVIAAELKQGRSEDLTERLGLTPGKAYDHQTWQFLRDLQRDSSAVFLDGLETRSTGEYQERLPQSRAMVELFFQTEKLQPNNESKQAYYIYLLTHIGAGSSDQIETNLSSNSLENLAELKKRWNRPEYFLRHVLHWIGNEDEKTPSRRAALRLLLSDHARLDDFWSTSPKALSDALRGNKGSDRARDLEVVLSELDVHRHRRADWIQLLLGSAMLDQEGADVAELIRLFAPGAAEITKPSDLRGYHQKFAARWKECLFNSDETSTTYEDVWPRIGEVVNQLETDEERSWAGSTLYYFTRNERDLSKDKALDDAWIEEQMRSQSVAHRMSLLGVLYRAQANKDPLPEPIKETLMGILNDQALPFYLRYQACQDVVRTRYYKDTDDDIHLAVAALLDEYLQSGYDLYDSTAEYLLRMYYRKELSEAWMPEVRDALQAWTQAVLADEGGHSSGSAFNIIRTLSLLSLKLGETESIPALATVNENVNYMNIDYFMWLIRYEMYELAERLLEQRDMLGNRFYSYGYDEKLHANLPAFIERYATPEARYRAELTFAWLVDSEQFPLPAGLPDRQGRCRDLLQRFDAHANGPDADKMLDLITVDETLELEAAPWLAKRCEALSMQSLCEQLKANKYPSTELSLYVKHLSNQVRVGELDFVRAELEVLAGFDLANRDYRRLRGPFEDLLLNLYRGFIDDAAVGDPARMEAWLALAEALCGVYHEPELTARGRNQRRVYLMYYLAQQAARPAVSANHGFQDSTPYKVLDAHFDRYGMRNLVNLDDGLGWGETEQERTRLFTALRLFLQNEDFLDQRWLENPGQLTGGLRFRTEFEQTALLKVLPERIAAGTRYEPWLAFILAEDCYAPQERTEAAIQWYRRARETALASEDTKFRTTAGDATLRLAALWEEAPGGRTRALKLLEATPDHVYSEEGLASAKALFEKLNTSGEN